MVVTKIYERRHHERIHASYWNSLRLFVDWGVVLSNMADNKRHDIHHMAYPGLFDGHSNNS